MLHAIGLALSIAAAGCSSSTTTAGPSPVKCQVALATSSTSLAAGGGTGTVSVSTQPECAWSATSEASWISGLSPGSGQGNGQVAFQVAANPLPSARQGAIAVNDIRVSIRQEAATCAFAIAPLSRSVAAAGGTGSITVTAGQGCAWSAASGASWITITSGATGVGSGSVAFTFATNTGTARRIGTITIAGQTFTLTQEDPECAYSIAPQSQTIGASGGAGTPIAVSTASNCAWTATSTASWLTITTGASGNGNGTVAFSVAANVGVERTATLTIADQTFTVTQAAAPTPCTYMITPPTQSIGASGGPGTTVMVTTTASCAWTAGSNAPWLTITSGATGNGNGSVDFTIGANAGAARTGTLTVAGHSFTVTQGAAPAPCAYAINPTSQPIGASGGTGSVMVMTTAGCAWTASENLDWLTIGSGTPGSGNGSVGYTVDANTGPERTGALTIAGQTLTVTQVSGCTFTIGSSSVGIDASNGAGTVSVMTPAGCEWTAAVSSTDTWLMITSGASGNGDGTVVFSGVDNTGPERTGTIMIEDKALTVTQAGVP